MRKEIKIECFVPALALEHADNQERIEKKQKIRLALLRYYFNEDFFESIPTWNLEFPFVILEKISFHKIALGYEISATLRFA